MNSAKIIFSRQARLFAVAGALLLAAILPALVSAAQVTERSIQLSSSSVKATNVSYKAQFTPAATAGAVVIDFCSNSPVIGEACTAPVGFNASSATLGGSTTAGLSLGALTVTGNNKVMVSGSMTAATPVIIELAGVTNPDNAGSLYARIVTYTDSTGAAAYASATPGEHIDEGGVALSITPTVGVSGAVLESMLFCVSGDTIGENCVGTGAGAPALVAPTLKLGKDTAGVVALDSTEVSSGTINTQISTNAVNGAVVYLKSSALGCGGLINSSNPSQCYITPALLGDGDITAGQAKFGVKTGTAAGVGTGANGTFQPVAASNYSSTRYLLNYVAGNATGVTSTYGDAFLDTANLPVNNMGMPLTFGASVSNQTPAGNYSADLSLIATGKF